jgi:hypothetical protein
MPVRPSFDLLEDLSKKTHGTKHSLILDRFVTYNALLSSANAYSSSLDNLGFIIGGNLLSSSVRVGLDYLTKLFSSSPTDYIKGLSASENIMQHITDEAPLSLQDEVTKFKGNVLTSLLKGKEEYHTLQTWLCPSLQLLDKGIDATNYYKLRNYISGTYEIMTESGPFIVDNTSINDLGTKLVEQTEDTLQLISKGSSRPMPTGLLNNNNTTYHFK